MADKLNTQCVTPEFTASYVNVFEAKANDQGDMKYSISMLFPKDMDLSQMEEFAHNAAVNAWGADEKKWPRKYKMPFRDGDEDRPDDEPYIGMIFVNSSVNRKPVVKDLYRNSITDEDEFYSGCKARAQGNFGMYNNKGNVGIAFYVNSLLKVADGDRIGGGPSADSAFADFYEEGQAPTADALM